MSQTDAFWSDSCISGKGPVPIEKRMQIVGIIFLHESSRLFVITSLRQGRDTKSEQKQLVQICIIYNIKMCCLSWIPGDGNMNV